MNQALVVTYLVISLLELSNSFDVNVLTSHPRADSFGRGRRCTHVRTYHMLGADCAELHLSYIPYDLKPDIEILDLTFNRIREIQNSTFINYSSLRFLYLADNSIAHIDIAAFEPLSELEVLDLSLNSLHAIPSALASLSALWKLSLANNPLSNPVFFDPLPSLEVLSIAECKLKTLPNVSMLPGLRSFNISYNRLQKIDVHQVAALCRLKEMDLSGNPKLFRGSYCDCMVLTTWISQRNIVLHPLKMCDKLTEGIELVENSTICFNNETKLILEESSEIARSCELEVASYGSGPIRLKNYFIWLIVAGCCVSTILVCCLFLFCAQRRQNKDRKRTDSSNVRLTSTLS